jgi:hypothetical protein
VDEWLKFRISPKPATLVKHLRKMEHVAAQDYRSGRRRDESPEAKNIAICVLSLLARGGRQTTAAPAGRETAARQRRWRYAGGRSNGGRSGRGGGRSGRTAVVVDAEGRGGRAEVAVEPGTTRWEPRASSAVSLATYIVTHERSFGI